MVHIRFKPNPDVNLKSEFKNRISNHTFGPNLCFQKICFVPFYSLPITDIYIKKLTIPELGNNDVTSSIYVKPSRDEFRFCSELRVFSNSCSLLREMEGEAL